MAEFKVQEQTEMVEKVKAAMQAYSETAAFYQMCDVMKDELAAALLPDAERLIFSQFKRRPARCGRSIWPKRGGRRTKPAAWAGRRRSRTWEGDT